MKPPSTSIPGSTFQEISLIDSLVWQPYVPLMSNFENKGGCPVLQVAQVYDFLCETSCWYHKLPHERMVRNAMTSSFSAGHIFGKPRFTVTELHQEPKFFTSEPFLVWNEDILSLPWGRDLNQRRAFGNWQARAAECCRTNQWDCLIFAHFRDGFWGPQQQNWSP